jgi:intraflagellar transport protein 80
MMKLNISVKAGEHSDIATSVAWSNENNLFSCSDDKTITKWSSDGAPLSKITSVQSFTTGISWFPSPGGGKQVRVT